MMSSTTLRCLLRTQTFSAEQVGAVKTTQIHEISAFRSGVPIYWERSANILGAGCQYVLGARTQYETYSERGPNILGAGCEYAAYWERGANILGPRSEMLI